MSNETLKAAFFSSKKKKLFYHNSPFSCCCFFYPHKSVSLHFLEISIYEAVIGFAVNALVLYFHPLLISIMKVGILDCPWLVCVMREKAEQPG